MSMLVLLVGAAPLPPEPALSDTPPELPALAVLAVAPAAGLVPPVAGEAAGIVIAAVGVGVALMDVCGADAITALPV
jgi:hypothetical protein